MTALVALLRMPLNNDPNRGPCRGHPVFRTTWKETIAVLTQSTEKYQPILQTARQLFESEPDWVTFFREILGVDGIVRRQFTRLEDLTAFEKSQEFDQIQKWLVKLRENRRTRPTPKASRPASSRSGCRRACTSTCGPRLTTSGPA